MKEAVPAMLLLPLMLACAHTGGAGPSEGYTAPRLIDCSRYIDPPSSVRAWQVTVRFDVTERGEVRNAAVTRITGATNVSGLRPRALDSINSCRFEPATRNGVAVEAKRLTRVLRFAVDPQ